MSAAIFTSIFVLECHNPSLHGPDRHGLPFWMHNAACSSLGVSKTPHRCKAERAREPQEFPPLEWVPIHNLEADTAA